MKSLLFAAFALSLVLAVSAQCDLNAVLTCIQDYTNMVSKDGEATAILCMQMNFFFANEIFLPGDSINA